MSGTTTSVTDKITLANVDAICQLIRICSKTNINKFSLGELILDFGMRDPSTKTPQMVETKPQEQEIIQIKEEVEDQKNMALLQDDLDHLRLSDPLAYERYLEGEIGDGESP